MDLVKPVTDLGKKIFGTQNERELKSIHPIVARINDLEKLIKPLSNDQLKGKTAEFRQRLANGEKLDSLLPEAFAVVREAAWRAIGQRHYDVQLVGGVTLHRGRIAEMRTGEGKTLVATLPCYFNALEGKGVHVVTVNDYLARRDANWMGQIYGFLGLSTGVIVHGLNDAQRKANYNCDITYGTNNEFGFDYLRDNMKFRLDDYVQRDLHYAIVDEVDSILIDEARTPLIISGPTDDNSELYYKIDRQITADGGLTNEADYTVEEKTKTAALTEAGVEKMEKRLAIANLYDPANIEILHHVNQALRAHVLFKRDVDYVVKEGEVLIVDEHTGRLMPGRRWSDGLHQAIEAKEDVQIENENQTLATITFQNYFRMYKKLSGMTGTADTEAAEFKQIYNLDVTIVPTNKPMIRQDTADMIFKSEKGKYKTIIQEIQEVQAKGQPLLVGTVSVEKSERVSAMLKAQGIRHHVLNAKHHEREAEIVAQAGRKGAITIATNMAGRGTDILLGGDPEKLAKAEVGTLDPAATPKEREEHEKRHAEAKGKWEEKCSKERDEVKQLGGLYILGTERHESRRIDNQLRGRSGRQGDPGRSRFYLSLDDDLMRIFGSVNIGRFMEEDVPIEHKWITKAIENAQKKVEGHNYDIRKHLLEYDDVMNQQRKIIYAMRREVLSQPNLKDMVLSMGEDLAEAIAQEFFPNGKPRRDNGASDIDMNELRTAIRNTLLIDIPIHVGDIEPYNDKGLKKLIVKLAQDAYARKEQQLGEQMIRQIEKMILLTTIDHLWKDHLLAMDHLREGINLKAYGQLDPLVEYKKQGFQFFQMMMNQVTGDVVRKIFAVQLAPQQEYGTGVPAGFPAGFDEEEMLESEYAAQEQRMQYNITDDGSLVPVQTPAQAAAAMAPPPAPARVVPPLGRARPQPAPAQAAPDFLRDRRGPSRMSMGRGPVGGGLATGNGGSPIPQSPLPTAVGASVAKVGRNDPCPCGSGKKYKKCHGA